MILRLSILLSVLLVFNTAHAKGKSRKRAKRHAAKVTLKKVGSCNTASAPASAAKAAGNAGNTDNADKKILLIKQWDLLSTTSTKGFKEKYAQERNQTAIYKKLDQDVKSGAVQLIVAEGCEGEIDGDFSSTFNGWDLESLKAQAGRRGFEKIITSVPMKIKAKNGAKIRVVCGDDLDMIREASARLSNLRGWTGYWSKFEQLKGQPDKLRHYIDAAARQLRVPASTPVSELADKVQAQMKSEIAGLNESLNARDDGFVKVLQKHDFQTAAVVVSGLHMADLKAKLEQAGMACDVLEPPGYVREEEELIQNFQRILSK